MSDDERGGYGNPPRSGRFVKKTSGNPKGRPPGRHRLPPHEAVLGQTVTVRENGIERKVAAAEAFLLYLAQRGLEGDGPSMRYALEALEGPGAQAAEPFIDTIIFQLVGPGRVNSAARTLGIGVKLDAYRPSARMVLEPWVVEAALNRLGDRQLSVSEQQTIVEATRTPRKVKWPEWWSERSWLDQADRADKKTPAFRGQNDRMAGTDVASLVISETHGEITQRWEGGVRILSAKDGGSASDI